MKRLKIQAYCQVLKTLNNNIGVNGIMMQLDNAIEWDTSKRNKLELRQIKGLKGWLRHKYMKYYNQKEIEVCYSTSKEEYKDRKVNIPRGYHLLGECDGKCPIYNIFGGIVTKKEKSSELNRTSKISIFCPPVISKEGYFKLNDESKKQVGLNDYNVMHFGIESSSAIGENDESLQNFSKQFLSGNFMFYIDISKLDMDEIKVLIDVLLKTDNQLGSSKTYGNGHIELKEIKYEDVNITYSLCEDGKIIKREDIKDLTRELFQIVESHIY